jgi:hypothetical protein
MVGRCRLRYLFCLPARAPGAPDESCRFTVDATGVGPLGARSLYASEMLLHGLAAVIEDSLEL